MSMNETLIGIIVCGIIWLATARLAEAIYGAFHCPIELCAMLAFFAVLTLWFAALFASMAWHNKGKHKN